MMNSYAINHKGTVVKNDIMFFHFQCKYDHEFKLSLEEIESNKWCPICSEDEKLHIIYIANLLQDYGRKIHIETSTVEDIDKEVLWECCRKHNFKLTFGDVFYKNKWCPFCPVNYQQLILETALKQLFSVSPIYLRTKTTYQGKIYIVSFDYFYKDMRLCIKYNGSDRFGLPDFVNENKSNIDLQKLCEKNNLRLINISYDLGIKDMIQFLCSELQKFKLTSFRLNINKIINDTNCICDTIPNTTLLKEFAKRRHITIDTISKDPNPIMNCTCSNGHQLYLSAQDIVFLESPCIICFHDETKTKLSF